ncbi:uncharacterized protein LOC130671089 [Microplitis mediator]|uniref:uncharacterized protein LOC130671089 n=1 Tax=Microplitis mediator TaxID=375433 RepID=UPI0025557781|nr:uncharacterized protein LOC130671089 [Microplitis mediator]
MKDNHLILIIQTFLIAVIIIVLLVILYKIYLDNLVTKDDNKVLVELLNPKISDEDYKIVQDFETDKAEYLNKATLDFTDPDKFVSLCDFAVRILLIYNKNRESKVYIQLVDDIITKLNTQILSTKNYIVLKSGHEKVNFKTLVHLMRLLNTFEYVANNEYEASKKICQDKIIEILPETNKVKLDEFERIYPDQNAIYTIIPRLLTYRLMSDKKEYHKDIDRMKVLDSLKKQLNANASPEKRKDIYLYDYHYSLYKSFSNENKYLYI